ncbi:hypothetical protein [Arthrobacter sp.]|uniref:hypothetical protein n=1 Tax=Arthrobacter sp. TaxID=1667 RepID=UPI00258CCBF0|nr:hypothetical protein [Arthrobacter sp.]
MARIRSFTHTLAKTKRHPTEVDAPEGTLLQLSTFGSDNQESVPKVSQTIQLDRAMAKQMKAALEQEFPGI